MGSRSRRSVAPIRMRSPWFASCRRGDRMRRKSRTAPDAATFSIYALLVSANDGTVNVSPGAGVTTAVPAPAAVLKPAMVWIAVGMASGPLELRVPANHRGRPRHAVFHGGGWHLVDLLEAGCEVGEELVKKRRELGLLGL